MMLPTNIKRVMHLTAIPIVFIGGLIVGQLIALPFDLTVSKELNPLHGLSILTTILSVIIISIVLDKRKERNKSKKDLIIRKMDELYGIGNEILLVSSANHVELRMVNTKLKKFGMLTVKIQDMAKHAELIDTTKFDDIIKSHHELRSLLTLTEPKSKITKKPEMTVSTGVIAYTQDAKTRIDMAIFILQNLIFQKQVEITSV